MIDLAPSQANSPLKRGVGRPVREYASFAGTLRRALYERRNRKITVRYDDPRFFNDPAGWARAICGVELWDMQEQILCSVRDHDRVTIRAAQKVSKTHSAALLILWFWATRGPGARVIFTAPTFKQVQSVIYRQVLQLVSQTGLCLDCKLADPDQPRPCAHSSTIRDGEGGVRIAMAADTGIQSDDFRSINGFVASDTEGLAGLSSPNMLVVIDEASNVAEQLYLALEGNLSAGGKLLAISNPTRNFGWFYLSHTTNSAYWCVMRISAFDSPNYKQGVQVVPGVASREVVERRRTEWGEQSAAWKIRVCGEFAVGEEGRAYPAALIETSFRRWAHAVGAGPLQIGLDPAGPRGTGDEAAVSVVRGNKHLWLETRLGQSEDETVQWVLALAARFGAEREQPVVVVDREGSVGAPVYGLLLAHAQHHPGSMRLVGVRAGERIPVKLKKPHALVRDELFEGLHTWLDSGGSLWDEMPAHDRTMILQEFGVIEWTESHGKTTATGKPEIRKRLGNRSCDRLDALALSVYVPHVSRSQQPRPTAPAASRAPTARSFAERHDLRAAARRWQR